MPGSPLGDLHAPHPLTPLHPQVSIFFLVLAARATCATPQGFEKKGTA